MPSALAPKEHDRMYSSVHYSDVIVTEVIKRRSILLDMNDLRNPEANRRKNEAWMEIQDKVLLSCRKAMSVEQIKRTWRNKKSHVKDVIMKEKKYRSATGGGVDQVLEEAIANSRSKLTEAELEIAKVLGKEAVFMGLGNCQTYVDVDEPQEKRPRLGTKSGSDSSGWSSRSPLDSPPIVDKDAARVLKMAKLQQQLDEFPSDSDSEISIRQRPKRNNYSDSSVNKLQLEILKEERALIAKKSMLLDRQMAFYEAALEMMGRPFRSAAASSKDETSLNWTPLEGDSNLAMSHYSK